MSFGSVFEQKLDGKSPEAFLPLWVAANWVRFPYFACGVMPVFPLGVSDLVRAEVFAVSVELFSGYWHRFGSLLGPRKGILCGSCGDFVTETHSKGRPPDLLSVILF